MFLRTFCKMWPMKPIGPTSSQIHLIELKPIMCQAANQIFYATSFFAEWTGIVSMDSAGTACSLQLAVRCAARVTCNVFIHDSEESRAGGRRKGGGGWGVSTRHALHTIKRAAA